jgi:hypothetical protein
VIKTKKYFNFLKNNLKRSPRVRLAPQSQMSYICHVLFIIHIMAQRMLDNIQKPQKFKISIQGVEVFNTEGAEDTAAIVHTLASRSCVTSFTVTKSTGLEPFVPTFASNPPPVPNKPGPKPKAPDATKKPTPAPATNTRKRKEPSGPVSSDIAEDLWVSAGGVHENDNTHQDNDSE